MHARPLNQNLRNDFHQSGVSPLVVSGSINGVLEKLFIRDLGTVGIVAKSDRRLA